MHNQVVMEGRSKWNEIKSISNGLEVLRNEILEMFMSNNNRTIVFKSLFNQYESTVNELLCVLLYIVFELFSNFIDYFFTFILLDIIYTNSNVVHLSSNTNDQTVLYLF